MQADEDRAHVLIPTHTPRYLDLVFVGLSRQTRRPDTITVSCDVDDPVIGGLIETWATKLDLRITWVRRAHHGVARLCQVRNNGIRAIAERIDINRKNRCRALCDRLIVLDGDTVASDTLVERHLRLAKGRQIICAYRVNVAEDVSASLSPDRLLSGEVSLEPSHDDRRRLAHRARRYKRQQLLRSLRLGPLHKPKMLGGHFSVTLELCLALNGFDEEYEGWGLEDDDFTKRAARLGARRRIAVEQIIAFHLYHASRNPGRIRDLPAASRFARLDLPVIAEHGVRNPVEQHPVEIDTFGPSSRERQECSGA